MLEFLNPIQLIIFITFLFGLFYLTKQKSNENKLLLCILSVYLLTEISSIFLQHLNYSLDILYNISMPMQFLLWLLLLLTVFKKEKTTIISIFVILISLSLFNNYMVLNKTNFLLGAFMYLVLYIYNVYELLKAEKIEFFQSNQFILISSPILFFLGMGFMFAFPLRSLRSTVVFEGLKLYTIVNYFINIVLYLLINIYIFKERKLNE